MQGGCAPEERPSSRERAAKNNAFENDRARVDERLTPRQGRTQRANRFAWRAPLVALWMLAAGTATGMDVREAELFAALDRFDSGDRAGGFESLHQVTAHDPDFLAARIIEISLLKSEDVAATLADLALRDDSSPMKEPRDEAFARLSYWFERPAPGHLPSVLIEAPPDRNKVVVADAARSRLYLFDRTEGEWTMWGDWYASIGRGGTAKRREGDGKTPLGVYFTTMWVGDRYLPELYGAGALGLNYPNEWDERRRRDGYGIWIHGEPRGLKSRAPRWSRGCLTISNPALEAIEEAIEAQSIPVIIGERLRWLGPNEHERLREDWLARIAYLGDGNAVNRGVGIYGYPVAAGDESTMVLVEFPAERAGGRRWWQYWRENGDGIWRIAHEGPASFSEVHHKGLPPRMPPGGIRHYAP